MLRVEPSPGPVVARFQFRLRTLLAVVAATALFIATNGLGIVGLRYPRAVENQPLLSPIKVVAINGNELTLADGRVLTVMDSHYPLNETISQSDDQIDLDVSGDDSLVFIHVKSRLWICGTPWACVVNIPLIPDDVPRNRREMIGCGKFTQETSYHEPGTGQIQK